MKNEFVIVNENGGFTSTDVRNCKSLDQLDKWEQQVDNDILSITVKMMAAERAGDTNEDWYHNANIAKRVQGALKILICKRRSDLKKVKQMTYTDYLLKATKEHVTEEEWHVIKRRAKEMMNEDKNSAGEKDL